ncbi:twin-arginine translocase subunit TatC [Planococcus sp. N028]|uniref:Sec-independent protein translocase protein TatC n=1 Tax=Planococcus shixiaomingii TaxID=3058393 RepID=A0ABT8N5T0_9BACL|nr:MULTISPECIES: twin-arginine translocase subunit TatC [unclassified Planococcus (in: firmicutes)]MDN7243240.1 twin-arginine translocase subunit TatC [Planococcus sp. N028]WKA55183.1 twin-arginine translocase subunit TatC [Planococcus sp. N022]
MDPYGEKKLISPLHKKAARPEESVEQIKMETPRQPEPPMVPAEEDTHLETLIDHLGELRKQLIKSAFVFLFFLIVVFSTINYWFPYVVKGHDLVILGPMEVIRFYTSISMTLALGLSLPFLCYFLWQFVKPGLKEEESKFIGLYSPVMLFLFLIGVAFGYFVVNPLSYNFLLGMGAVNFAVMISASEYIHFLIITTVPLGLMFELPIVALFLSSIGLLTSANMKKIRKWSYLVITIVAAVITPPDFLSQFIIMIPMIILYETSIYLIKRIETKKANMESSAV